MSDILEDILKPEVKKRKIRIRYLAFIGIAIIIAGFLYDLKYAGIPYQDLPPELLKKYTQNQNIAGNLIDTGFLVLLIAIIGAIVRKIKTMLFKDLSYLHCHGSCLTNHNFSLLLIPKILIKNRNFF